MQVHNVHISSVQGELIMVKVNLLFSAGPGIYGTATWEDIATVCGAAIAFCATVGLIFFGVVRIFLA
jgi:hypothetical protein